MLGVSPVPPRDTLLVRFPYLTVDNSDSVSDVEMVSINGSKNVIDTLNININNQPSNLSESSVESDNIVSSNERSDSERKTDNNSDFDHDSTSSDERSESRYLEYESDAIVYVSSSDSDDEKMHDSPDIFHNQISNHKVCSSDTNEDIINEDVMNDLDDYMDLQQYRSKLEMLLEDPNFAFLRRDCSETFQKPLYYFMFSFEFVMPRTTYV